MPFECLSTGSASYPSWSYRQKYRKPSAIKGIETGRNEKEDCLPPITWDQFLNGRSTERSRYNYQQESVKGTKNWWRIVLDEAQMVSNGSQNTSLVSDRRQICFVDGFERQQVAVAVQILSVLRASDGGSGSSIVNPKCLTSFVWNLPFVQLRW